MTSANRSPFTWRPSRRDVLFLGIGGVLAAVPFARQRPLTLVRRNVLVMGTVAEFAVAHRDPREAHAAIDAAIDALRRVDHTMSRFKPSSDVGRANAQSAHAPVSVTAATMDVLSESLQWAVESNGAFDPCLGRATMLWDVAHRDTPPAASEVARLGNRRLYRSLELGHYRGDPVVRFHDDDVTIDLGGIAKGYGVDRAVAALRACGVAHALVGAGGDLYALGRSPAGEPWRVGIQSPDRADTIAASIVLEDAAIATSGDYQQYFVHQQRRYHHLLDAQSGAPRTTAHRSVSVMAATCMVADAGATLAFGMDALRAEAVLARHGAHVAHAIAS
jgi:FAD:protein FMN transferase